MYVGITQGSYPKIEKVDHRERALMAHGNRKRRARILDPALLTDFGVSRQGWARG
jgi:hypothetical protein